MHDVLNIGKREPQATDDEAVHLCSSLFIDLFLYILRATEIIRTQIHSIILFLHSIDHFVL